MISFRVGFNQTHFNFYFPLAYCLNFTQIQPDTPLKHNLNMQPNCNFNNFIKTPKPQPRHLIVQHAPDSHEEQNQPEDFFAEFYTPQRENQEQEHSHLQAEPFLSCPVLKNKPRDSLDLDFRQEKNFEPGEIQELDFPPPRPQNREAPATPFIERKREGRDEQMANATTRKKPQKMLGTPHSEGKGSERTLRRLAHEAFKFTCSQKRTTYKEVANKLIAQLGEQSECNSQMNIKRRVYDALNVLIALGVLKRISSSKILSLSRKTEYDFHRNQGESHKGKDLKREQQLLQELERLKGESSKRKASLEEKQIVHRVISTRIHKMRELQMRNMNKRAEKGNMIQLPFLAVEKGEQKDETKMERGKSRLMFWCGSKRPQILGDADLMTAHLEVAEGWVSMADSKPADS